MEVVILSRNDPVSGMRVFRSAQHYGLPIQRGVFTRGESPWRYLKPLAANLFLSTNEPDVRSALELPACPLRACTHIRRAPPTHTPTKCASPSTATRCCSPTKPSVCTKAAGSTPSRPTSARRRKRPSPPARSSRCCRRLQLLQKASNSEMRIRTALVTARSAPAHERAIRTLMDWHIEVDEAMFLGGLAKGAFLREFEPDFFFDDQTGHIQNAALHVPSGHVASGVSNP